ncbi:MAG: DUF975 family protein [Clostridia bacterium]|nr:DUF975 family protein [Clostridia bacterium]
MSASEIRRMAREALAGKWGKAALVTLVFSLITGALNAVLGYIPFIGGIAQLLLEIPLAFGFAATLIKLMRGEEIGYLDFFSTGLSNFKGSWLVTLWTAIKLIVPIILMIIFYVVIIAGALLAIQDSPYGATITSSQTLTPEQLSVYLQNIPANQLNSTSLIMIVVGFIGLIASAIWLTVKNYLYKPVMFILFDNPDKAPKEIVEDSAKIMTGNRWKYFCLELSFIGWAILASLTCGIGMLWLIPYTIVAQVCFYEVLAGKKDNSTATVEEEKTAE